MLDWLNAKEATQVGTALADDFVLQTSGSSGGRTKGLRPGAQDRELQKFLNRFLQRVDREVRPLQLNVFKRAKLANSFKWRLLEKGVEQDIVDELTQALVLRLTARAGAAAPEASNGMSTLHRAGDSRGLVEQGNECLSRGAYSEAVNYFEEALNLDSRNAVARNNLGAALCKLGRYQEAEDQFRRAVGAKESFADAHGNLGAVLQWQGRYAESESQLRRALKLKPTYLDAQITLGRTLVLLGRMGEARTCFDKALKLAPRNVFALVGAGQIAAAEGRLDEAENIYKRAIEVDQRTSGAWAGLAGLRKMTAADGSWLEGAESAATDLPPLEEANMRYAIGKYYDDIGDYGRAFRSFQRANQLQKTLAQPYDRAGHARFVDDLIARYTRDALTAPQAGAADSGRPVLVVGMMRSGTSLVEQIIASHPAAVGAGELEFWRTAVGKHETALRRELVREPLARKLAGAYLRELETHSKDALRVVDKATVNSDFLGIIHSVFPNARMIYLQRDPVDTCLSCFFQQFSPAVDFAMDLGDLAHYYGEHRRLMAHWRSALPPGTLLEVPYAELITDQEAWTRRIVEFIGLEWNERCLDFHKTDRTVLTASFWQVRQPIYKTSLGRWRHYEKFIGPLLPLRGMA
jgi:tetratricopeptide (TPR) repeat protein